MAGDTTREEMVKLLADMPEHLRAPFAAYIESKRRLDHALKSPELIITPRARTQYLREQHAAAIQYADDVERLMGALNSNSAEN